jgi:Heterokaryon incompatibility protein (HET)
MKSLFRPKIHFHPTMSSSTIYIYEMKRRVALLFFPSQIWQQILLLGKESNDKDLLVHFARINPVCIDQNNEEERGQQVQQMGSIYSQAERVIIWLGEATYDTDYVMHYMKQLGRAIGSSW